MSEMSDFFAKHLEYLVKGDIEGLVRDHYHDDAEMVTFEFVTKGKDELYNYLKNESPAKMGRTLGSQLVSFVESDDVLCFTAIINSEKMGYFVARDAFYLRDGKIARHIALTLPPDKDTVPVLVIGQKTREVVEKYFAAINTRDWDTWLTLFDENVVVDEALSGHLEGLPAMKASADGIDQGFTKFENHIEELVVDGDRAMVVCRIEAVTAAGRSLESTGANFYRVNKDGKITYMSSFHDKEAFLKAFSS